MPPESPPTFWQLLRIWLSIGVQSFGGGMATLTLIRREVTERRNWLSEAEFTHDWSLCQMTPGINLIAFTVLIGRRVSGPAGVIISLVGLLLPSVTITILITALYAGVRQSPVVQSVLRGVIPATVGLGLAAAWQMARPLLKSARKESMGGLVFSVLVILGSGLVLALSRIPVILVLLFSGLTCAFLQWRGICGRRQREAK